MTSTNFGSVVAVRGSVVDVRFDRRLPSIHTLPSIHMVLHMGAGGFAGPARDLGRWRARSLAIGGRGLGELHWPTKNLPEVIGRGSSTLRSLIREYLFVSLFRACAESLASENAGRLAAMQRADKNIDELLEEFNRTFLDGVELTPNRARRRLCRSSVTRYNHDCDKRRELLNEA